MAREYARLRISASDDPDVEALTIEAQWLYFKVLLPYPSLSNCGVMDWRPKHLVRKGKNASVVKILAAAAELERERFLMFDLETEEVLLRSYVRGDELLKNPKMAGAVIKSYHSIASRELQAALVTEMKRIREEHPDYSSWSHKDTEADLTRILSRPDLASVGYTGAFADQVYFGNTDVNAVEITNPDVVQDGYFQAVSNGYRASVPNADVVPGPDDPSDSVPIPSTYTRSHKPAPDGGDAAGVRHQSGALENDPPPRSCPEHPEGTTDACSACGIFRRARVAHDAEAKRQKAEARAAEVLASVEVRRQAIANCPLGCAENDGYRDGRVCDHDPRAEEAAIRGMAEVRAALADIAAKKTDPATQADIAKFRAELAEPPPDPNADQSPLDPDSPGTVPTGRSESTFDDESLTTQENAHA